MKINKVEKAFLEKQNWYYKNYQKRDNKDTQKQRVLKYLQENRNIIWWWSWEVVNKTTKAGKFISHRGCARLTDLVNENLLESRAVGIYTVYKLK